MRNRFHLFAFHWRKGFVIAHNRYRIPATTLANQLRKEGFTVVQWGR